MSAPQDIHSGLTAQRLRELLAYAPDTGRFTRRVHASNNPSGSIAGHIRGDGYRGVKIEGRRYLEHRLAWLYVHGRWPDGELDHRDGDRSNNRLDNLRPATRSQNMGNRTTRSGGKTGVRGVTILPSGSYNMRVRSGRRVLATGTFPTLAEAAEAADKARREVFGEYADRGDDGRPAGGHAPYVR